MYTVICSGSKRASPKKAELTKAAPKSKRRANVVHTCT